MKNIICPLFLLLVIFSLSIPLFAQSQYEGHCCPFPPGQGPTPTSYDIYEDIQRLGFLGSVLYVAAHPDDENTNLLSYLSNHLKAKTSYLSLTRGDGGQNRIGAELREQLGVIRTQELLNARSVDGGDQYFSRANDFGYSKNPDETLDIWEEEKLLEDIVWIIRKTQPDVIINRFDHRTPGTTHGHHTTSAILSKKAFSMANSKENFSQQLDYVSTCQPKRLFLNQSSWFYNSQEEFEEIAKTKFTGLDVGVHYYGKGKSNNQIAADARSQHRCQGMGTTPKLGKQMEYLELLDGSALSGKDNIFSGINTTWERVKGSEKVKNLVEKLRSEYDFSSPYLSMPTLLTLYMEMQKLEDGHWRKVKLKELESIIFDCLNLHIVPLAESSTFVPGDNVPISLEIVNRVPQNFKLVGYSTLGTPMKTAKKDLTYNEPTIIELTAIIPEDYSYDNPYWLNDGATLGMYQVDSLNLRGLPESPANLTVDVWLEISGILFSVNLPISHKFTDPVVGQIYEPVKITPPVFVEAKESVYIFPTDAPRTISIEVKAGADDISGTLFPGQAQNWKCSPASVDFELAKKGMSQLFEFELVPPTSQEESELRPNVLMGSVNYSESMHDIRYQHIPRQMVFLPAKAKTVRIDLETRGTRIAYVMGAGDLVPDQLRQIGYRVDLLTSDQLILSKLIEYDALILGIRAYNVLENIPFRQKAIFDYVEKGGTAIVQYNTNHRLLVDQPGPYPITLSKDRVTKEDATITILKPDHPLLNYPNKISQKDFDNWVQERGLYFPSKWDDKYEALLSCHDPNENAKVSGLLYAKHGDGHFIHTGYSFFRQLPVGVPGAFRLFANLISVGKEKRP